MNRFQRIFFFLVAFFAFVNGTVMLMRWAQDTNLYKDTFTLVIGVIGVLVGLYGFFFSFKKFYNKDN